ncbi:IS30 family transposase [Arthrobacter mobilis]|uniref:IS30 family transposase n=1 Tax=Arthrobacter mobilis TaxID=2724944 RepID=A0A7X6K7U2_9MICC|nr:IS30 family transposase [Arthrobacter mobilis]NKX56755.1 IS30 family transposase [Arthrobacter mobilis]
MYQQFDSPACRRFLALIREGRGLKPSARAAGIGKETGYRWLRDEYLRLRDEGLDHAAAQAGLGFVSGRAREWNERFLEGSNGRHHFQVEPAVEEAFWSAYLGGAVLKAAAAAAGVNQSTAYRWLYGRFVSLRTGLPAARVGRDLRLSPATAAAWEARRTRQLAAEKARLRQVHLDGIRQSRLVAERAARPLSAAQARRALRETRYWELVNAGVSNARACRMLGMSRNIGTRLRNRRAAQPPGQAGPSSGRYLSLPERLQIADLLRLGCSLRRIGLELGRAPSTIKRELDRHRDGQGRYLPHTADDDARRRRRRPRERKLKANRRLRALVQRKLNRNWSPEQICGWLALRFPAEPDLRLCPETIYRALLFNDDGGLDKKYCPRLRTGRKIRRHRWRSGSGHGATVQDMTMIGRRPPEVETNAEAGHWEGDLILGPGSVSAMVTLRERKTHYGIIINLPADHTAATTNQAITAAFAALPAHLKRTLTWDQGVEMSRHRELAAATGTRIYFAERSSPWQRGANENFNGLARQYFPKGTDLSVHSEDHVRRVCTELNTRPRKSLGYLTPQALFRAEKKRIPTTAR